MISHDKPFQNPPSSDSTSGSVHPDVCWIDKPTSWYSPLGNVDSIHLRLSGPTNQSIDQPDRPDHGGQGSLAGPRCPEVEQDVHVAGRQAVHSQLVQRLLWRGSVPLPLSLATACPTQTLLIQADSLLQRLPEEVSQQEGRPYVQAQDDARLLHTGCEERKKKRGDGWGRERWE